MKKACALMCPHPIASRSRANLDASWSDRLAGMHISTCIGENQAPVATLTGRLRDQAELAGVLNTLYELHLTLLPVEHVDGD
jgi:hypothetical protein